MTLPLVHLASFGTPVATMTSEVLFWDGRLDNRADLERALDVKSASDHALVGGIYQRYGVAGLHRIVGDWSVVIRDGASGSIVLASDYAGVRPLYYHRQASHVCWSARLGAIVAATGVDALDDEWVAAFLVFGGCADRTPHAGIRCVPPGQAVVITPAAETVHRFWTAPFDQRIEYRDVRDYDAHLRALFTEAVAVRLQSAAPAISELSGGLDSSSVVCMADRLIRSGAATTPDLVTVSYSYARSTDEPFVRDVEQFRGREGVHVSTQTYPLTAADASGDAMPGAWVPLHTFVARLARERGAKTLLTGQNGDLAMGNWFDDSHQVAAAVRRGRLGRAIGEALAWSKLLRQPIASVLWRAALVALPPRLTPRALYEEGARTTDDVMAEASLRRTFWTRPGVAERLWTAARSMSWLRARPERRRHFRALAAMQELRTLQRVEALEGLDYTHPFAHRPLVEFVMSIPGHVLCRPGEPRRLMRRALGDTWPPRLRRRRSKSLFTQPWSDALRPLAADLLRRAHWHVVRRGWVEAASLRARLERLVHGLDCNEGQLRQIILLEHWLTTREGGARFCDGRFTAPFINQTA
jgi:asparagine synthase (glutamine-hydrolysing)